MGYWQERKAEESLDGLKQMMGQVAVVIVEGLQQTVAAESIVQGDFSPIEGGRCRTSGYAIDRKSWIGRRRVDLNWRI